MYNIEGRSESLKCVTWKIADFELWRRYRKRAIYWRKLYWQIHREVKMYGSFLFLNYHLINFGNIYSLYISTLHRSDFYIWTCRIDVCCVKLKIELRRQFLGCNPLAGHVWSHLATVLGGTMVGYPLRSVSMYHYEWCSLRTFRVDENVNQGKCCAVSESDDRAPTLSWISWEI